MHIFKQEIQDGLEPLISSSASISYACMVEPCSTSIQNNMKHIKSLASLEDSDLYYVQSILVSSSWNKNDDIFDKSEVWVARNTPEDKPTNLEHDENTIIGHITSNWPITIDGILIDENTPIENLPEKYHILTGSVIYKGFSSPDLRQRSEKLISEIENGTKYVSMECFFKGFDYGIINKSSGEYKVLNRNEETAYLTKFLRAYGGAGEHENYKIGRVLRNITFSGKGYVDKPANPDSVIFHKDSTDKDNTKILIKKNENLSIAGVSNNQSTQKVETNTMNSEQAQAEPTTEANSAPECAEAMALAAVSQEKITELENTIKTSEATLNETKAELEVLKEEKDAYEVAAKKTKEEMAMKEEEMKKMKAALEVSQSELLTANEVIATYKSKEEEMMKKEKKMKRQASLVEAGVDSETASSTVDKFESMDDDSFAALTLLLAAKKAKMSEVEDMEEDEEKAMKMKMVKSSESVDASVLDTAEVAEEVNLGVGGDSESAVEATRAALVEFVCSRLGKTL